MKTIPQFIKGLLIGSLFLTLLNVVAMFIPLPEKETLVSFLMDVTLYTTFVLTVLGIFYTVFFLLEDDSMRKITLMSVFYLMIPIINILGILVFLYLFMEGKGTP